MENQETNTNQAPQENQGQGGENQGFDINKVSKNDWIHGGIALLGAISIFLPVLALLAYLAIAVVIIAGKAIKIPEDVKKQIMSYGIYVPAAFTFWVFIDILTTSMVQPGIGVILSLLASLALILIATKVIKLK
jgi:hypothetical protein